MPTYECPTCNRIIRVEQRDQAPYRPFCSHRCQMIDLGKWFEGEYRISEPLEPPQRINEPEPAEPSG